MKLVISLTYQTALSAKNAFQNKGNFWTQYQKILNKIIVNKYSFQYQSFFNNLSLSAIIEQI